MGGITDADYVHGKRVCKDFEIKNVGEYSDSYVQGDTLLLADIFENFWNMCFEYMNLIGKFSALKKTKARLHLWTDINMLLMLEKGIRGGICRTIHQYAKANNKYLKDCDKNKELSYVKYWDINNVYGWVMPQK